MLFINLFKKVDKFISKKKSLLSSFNNMLDELKEINNKLLELRNNHIEKSNEHLSYVSKAEEEIYNNNKLIANIENLIGINKEGNE